MNWDDAKDVAGDILAAATDATTDPELAFAGLLLAAEMLAIGANLEGKRVGEIHAGAIEHADDADIVDMVDDLGVKFDE